MPMVNLKLAPLEDGYGRCPFLSAENRCCIFEDRPLRARLYPIGRMIDPEGMSYFFRTCNSHRHVDPSEGREFVLEEWLEVSGSIPFLDGSECFDRLLMSVDAENYRRLPVTAKLMFAQAMYDPDGLLPEEEPLGELKHPERAEEALAVGYRLAMQFVRDFVGFRSDFEDDEGCFHAMPL